MEHFIPTWLMIKQHKNTKLKYFCKTTKKNPIKYKGSGKRWQNHLQVHGGDVETLWCELFTDKEKLMEYAINFSVDNNIVESSEWANIIVENGIDGRPPGTNHQKETIEKCRINANGFKKGYTPWNKGINYTKEHRVNHAAGLEKFRKENPNWADQCRSAQKIGEPARIKACSKITEVDGVIYPSATDAAEKLGLKKITLIKRVKSLNFPTYKYLSAA
jgi:hypothetical protein